MSDKVVKFGIVGCGRIYKNHINAAKFVQGVEIVAICDSDEFKLGQAMIETGLPGFRDFRDLVGFGIDAVILCLPHDQHAQVCIEMASLGIHVLSEKPISTTLEDSDRMIAACDASGVNLGVVFQHRYNDNSILLKRLITDGDIGDLILGTAIFQYHKSASDSAYLEWRGTKKSAGGGVLANFGVHTVDLFFWLMGEVENTEGYISTLTLGTEVEDTAVASIQFKSGALGTIAATLSSSVEFESRITIAGTKASAILTDSTRLEVQRNDGRSEVHEFKGLLNDPQYPTKPPYGRGHIDVLKDFRLSILEGSSPSCNGQSARQTQRAILEIYSKSEHKSQHVKEEK